MAVDMAATVLILMVVMVFGIAAMIVLSIVVLIRLDKNSKMTKNDGVRDELLRLREKIDTGAKNSENASANLRREVNDNLREMSDRQQTSLHDISERQQEALRRMSESQQKSLREMSEHQASDLQEISERQFLTLNKLIKENQQQKDALVTSLSTAMEKLQAANDKKLNDIQGVVDQKLDKTLNERLDTNFSRVTEQLGNLYRSLGELKDLSGGVADLNRTLSNVKTRGNWGEVQLQRILEETMPRNQYECNVATKHNSNDRVEFAIHFPSVDGRERDVFMPIDAKFPADIYNKVIDASESGDAQALAAAQSELRARIRTEASSIKDKYIDPPYTTNFAFMYLPTEGLYAEVLRLDGLTEECQKKGVIVTGPTTITAVLNSLQVGFRNVALSKKSLEVMKILEAVKAQMNKMDEAVVKTQKKLTDAVTMTEDLQKRTHRLSSRMKTIGDMDEAESDRILGFEGNMALSDESEDDV